MSGQTRTCAASNGRDGICEDHFEVNVIAWEASVASVHHLTVVVVQQLSKEADGVASLHLAELVPGHEDIEDVWLQEGAWWVCCWWHFD